ncbi:MAG: exodeoxyribonuclease V subunit gamma, partial [Actinobacteria bacterium]|nr:exodeoxyribonuclease V subunit gamma [Actinomycetota bacterium]
MLHLHRSARADRLLSALTSVVSEPVPDPLSPEVICVPSRGIERWISQGIASGTGISANTRFPSPQALVERAIAESTGRDRASDPWVNGQLLWAVGQAVDENMSSPWLALVANQISRGRIDFDDETRQPRMDRVATFQYIRDLFATYHWMRPEMVVAWRDGRDVGPTGEELSDRNSWQSRLWREVRNHLNTPSPPELLVAATAKISDGSAVLDLPQRISAFGLTRLPSSVLSVLAAISVRRDVHLFALHPSGALWDEVAVEILGEESASRTRKRESDPTVALARNPMLRSWGRDSRELQLVLGSVVVPTLDHYYSVDEDVDINGPLSVLHRLQRSIRSNESDEVQVAVGDSRSAVSSDMADRSDSTPVRTADTSLQIHSCHGPVRQVQVLRDALLHELQDDPTLEPRDIVIMCPDVETYAPHINAVFGDFPKLRVRIADQSVLSTNPMISAVMALLQLADSRCTASEVIGFLHLEPVRTRFELTDDSLERLEGWIAKSGVRWGIDAQHRANWGLAEVAANTWESGVDRILAGVAMADEGQRLIGSVRPLDDVPSTDIDLAGQLAEFVSRLRSLVVALSGRFEVGVGFAVLRNASESLMSASGEQEWQAIALRQLLEELEAQTGSAGLRSQVSLNEFVDMVEEKLSGKPTRTNFRSGDITVCTLTPMRSVPHRVVALLGLDDGAFPRKGRTRGDDLTGIEPLIGDHDVRGEDRQLLLDAVLAAQDSLIITYSGRSERTNEALSPAVPLAELVTTLRRTTGAGSDSDVVVAHPLQPFDPRNFQVGTLRENQAWGFDPAAFLGAEQIGRQLISPPPFWQGSAPEQPIDSVSVDELVRFFQHPVKQFAVRRLNVRFQDFADEVADELSLELDPLQMWAVGERLLEVLINETDESAPNAGLRWIAAEKAAGTLPPGDLATNKVRSAYREVSQIARQVREQRGGNDVTSRAVRVEAAGVLVYGSVSGVCGNRIVDGSFSRLLQYSRPLKSIPKAKPRIAAWIRLLALAASYPDEAFTAAVVGRGMSGPSGSAVAGSVLSAPADALKVLSSLVEIYLAGMREPLPLFADSSQTYVRA